MPDEEKSEEDSKVEESEDNSPSADEKYCKNCGDIIAKEAEICPECGVRQHSGDKQNINVNVENQNQNIQSQGSQPMTSNKSKTMAAILAIFLGGFGVHKLYLGQPVRAILFFLFSWTGITFLIGVVQGIAYLLMSEQKFAQKFG
jgi:TM2 domain-containing membrane protein YozV/RNA polymerase subunit RPABC4/transcription elongation factor Spt4